MVLITRTQNQAEFMQDNIHHAGYKSHIADIINISYLHDNITHFKNIYSDYDGLIFTSGHAVMALQQTAFDVTLWNKPVYCVGEKTAILAQNLGFKNILYPHDSHNIAMADLIKKNHISGRFLYGAGVFRKKNLEDILSDYTIDTVELYRADENTHGILSDDAVQDIKTFENIHITCFSQRIFTLFYGYFDKLYSHFRGDSVKNQNIYWHVLDKNNGQDMNFTSKNYEKICFYASSQALYQFFFDKTML